MKTAPNTKINDEGAEEAMRCTILRRDFGMRRVWGTERDWLLYTILAFSNLTRYKTQCGGFPHFVGLLSIRICGSVSFEVLA
jgi:hypothetical protein